MSKKLRRKILDLIDPGRKDRGIVSFERPGSISLNVDRVLKRQQRRAERLEQEDSRERATANI